MASPEGFSGAQRRTACPLRERRLQLGLTVAELEYLSGVDDVTIWRAEHGHGTPARATRLLLAAALRADAADLFPDEPAPADGRP